MMLYMCLAAICACANAVDVVAFTKALTNHVQLGKGEVIPYNKDITNINAAFTSDGKFQALIPGVYSFHFHSLSQSGGETWLEVYKNDQYMVSLYAYTPHDWADAGNAVILELKAGDTVYAKAVDDYNIAVYGGTDEIYTTFSGELISSEQSGSITPVAFSAALTHNLTLNQGTRAVYDKILTNIGNGYNSTTGEFVVPTSGLYVIHYHALAENGEKMWLDLMLNHVYINSAYGQVPNAWADAGNSAILQLQAGDRLSINGRVEQKIVLYGGPNEVYCTFSAALLSAAESKTAFSVGLTRDIDNSGTPHRVLFDKVFINMGSGFNIARGIFTAKEHGIYVFHYHALADTTKPVWLELFHDNQYVNSLYGHAVTGRAGGSNTATLELSIGDTVYIDMRDHDNDLDGSGDEIYGTFSGYLLSSLS